VKWAVEAVPPEPTSVLRRALTAIRQWRIIVYWVELIETSTFTKQVTALLSDEQYREFQTRLAENPQLGAVIKSSGGIRKVRVAVGSRGKRGGACVVYYWAVRRDLILLLYAYAKNVVEDLTPKQVSQLGKVVKEEFGDEERDV
jgi:hypothetical protein